MLAQVVSKGFLHEDGRHSGGWRMYSTTCGITLKVQGGLDARRSSRKQEMSRMEEVWCSLVELPKIPSVVWMQGSSRRWKTFWWLKRLRCNLLELPKIPSVVWIQGSSRRRKTFRWLRRLSCRLVELPKIPSVVGCKYLQEGERHSDGWRGKVETCGATWCSGKQGKEQQSGWW